MLLPAFVYYIAPSWATKETVKKKKRKTGAATCFFIYFWFILCCAINMVCWRYSIFFFFPLIRTVFVRNSIGCRHVPARLRLTFPTRRLRKEWNILPSLDRILTAWRSSTWYESDLCTALNYSMTKKLKCHTETNEPEKKTDLMLPLLQERPPFAQRSIGSVGLRQRRESASQGRHPQPQRRGCASTSAPH